MADDPRPPRPLRARLGPDRAVAVALRTVHLGTMAAVVGGAWYGVPTASLRGALVGTALSGFGLLVTEARHSRHWAYQVRGLAVFVHLGLAAFAGSLGAGALVAALVVGAVGSHLPKGLRAWSLRHRAVVD